MKKIQKVMLILAVLLNTLIGVVHATDIQSTIDYDKKASLKIVLYENANLKTENIPLKDAEFTITKIPSTIDTVELAKEYLSNNPTQGITKITSEDGIAQFTDLELGKYLVVETNAPKNVTTVVEDFIIELPRTSEIGNGWDYDITIYPKNVSIYGNVTFVYNGKGENVVGTRWKVEKQDKEGNWQLYSNEVIDENSQFALKNVEAGEYRIVQENEINGYFLNQARVTTFTIDKHCFNYHITISLDKLGIEQYVMAEDGEFVKDNGFTGEDIVSWKSVAKIPKAIKDMEIYNITEEIPEGLEYVENSLKIYKADWSNEVEIQENEGVYEYNINDDNQIFIEFDTSKLQNYENVIIKFDTKFAENIDEGNFEVIAKLEYTNYISIDGISEGTNIKGDGARAYTASAVIKNIDSDGQELTGSKFKIATSEENAIDGKFLKDLNNKDFEVFTENGIAKFSQLKIGGKGEKYEDASQTYWIVQTETPIYNENGEEKHYSLLGVPFEITVDNQSGEYQEGITPTVVNTKPFVLPLTGGRFFILPICLGSLIVCFAIILKKKEKKNEKISEEK